MLGVLFWSLFPLLWLDRAGFALESPRAMLDLAIVLIVLKHCEAQGWLQCASCRHREKGFCPKELAAMEWYLKSGEDSGGERAGYRNPLLLLGHLMAKGPLLLEVS